MNTKPKKRYKITLRNVELYLMMIPGLVYLIINNYIPMFGLSIAFKKFNYRLGILGSPWTGFSNFTFLFKTKDAFNIIRNTVGYNITFIVLGQIVAVLVAVMLNALKSDRNKKAYQTLILLPYLISTIVVSYIVFGFLSTESGVINMLLANLGMQKVNFYTTKGAWPFILTIVNLWKGFGYSSIVYYATVVGIDTSLYEAAAIDGANTLQQVWHVTLPGLKNTVIVLTLMSLGGIMYSDFGLFYQLPMRSGLLAPITDTLDVYIYKALTSTNNIGRASAAGFLQSIVGFLLVIFVNLIVRKVDRDSALF